MALSLIMGGEIIYLPFTNFENNKCQSVTKENAIENLKKMNRNDERFVDESGNKFTNKDIQIIVDKVTGIHYLSDGVGGLTPLLDKRECVVVKK